MKTTWQPHEKHGQLTKQSDLPDTVYAFPKQRKEPMTDARHVRNAVARFDQVIDVSDADRALAFANIEKAAKHYGVNLSETSWHDLGVHPQRNRKAAAAKGVATRRRKLRSKKVSDAMKYKYPGPYRHSGARSFAPRRTHSLAYSLKVICSAFLPQAARSLHKWALGGRSLGSDITI